MTAQSTIRTVLILAAVTACPAIAQEVDTVAIREDTRILSHDSLLGRGTGTHGERVAARYISDRCEAIGLRPMGSNWEHPFNLHESSYPSAPSIAIGGTTIRTAVMVDLAPFAGSVEGNIAGFPSAREALASDLEGAVVLMAAPARPRTLPDSLRARGARGLILLASTPEMYAQYRASRGDSRLSLHPPGNDFPVLVVGPPAIEQLSAAVRSGNRRVRIKASPRS